MDKSTGMTLYDLAFLPPVSTTLSTNNERTTTTTRTNAHSFKTVKNRMLVFGRGKDRRSKTKTSGNFTKRGREVLYRRPKAVHFSVNSTATVKAISGPADKSGATTTTE